MFKKREVLPLTRSTIINPYEGQFKLATQQEDIVLAAPDNDIIIIEAIAGAAKSSSLVVVAHNNPTKSLYLTFSKALAVEAEEMFPRHVECRTIHSLAYREKGVDIAHKLSRPRGVYRNVAGTGSEIAKYYKIKHLEVAEDTIIKNTLIGLMVKQTIAKYEASDSLLISKDHLPHALIKVSKNKYKGLPKKVLDKVMSNLYKIILRYTNELWIDRQDSHSPVLATHDGYVKMWALTNPIIDCKLLYLDELQDSAMVFMGVVKNQVGKCKMIMVGDVDQNLYAWRYSVNGLALIEGKQMNLEQSFRYGQRTADLAMTILDNGRKMIGSPDMDTKVGHKDIVDTTKHYVKLFRMNASLLQEALEYIAEGQKVNIHVDVKGYIKMLESAEALYMGQPKKVKHEEIVPFDTWEELKDESKSSGILARVYNTVQKGDTHRTITLLHSHKNTSTPDITLMTCHASKGQTFDYVVLAEDFESNYEKSGVWKGIDEAERRLLYVGVTRAKFGVQYNNTVRELVEKADSERQMYPQEEEVEETIETLLTSEIDEYYEDGRVRVDDTIYDSTLELLQVESSHIPWWCPVNEEWMNRFSESKEFSLRESFIKIGRLCDYEEGLVDLPIK